ncbi:MAG TPA: ABC transporter substrate-binding protein [Spongiibacteraceae bacterium]|jgi:iron complex transport system substrate-binding protein|nr:ABC transporter substrate-binding protein [Spongiibacteraceae bacterium]HUH38229.1 ABC transporter substrate-binding protein [Spongiibacteraceae bacterium]
MRARAFALLVLALVVESSVAQARPQRIASLNLCTDQLLLLLVEPQRIVSLSYWAVRPEASYYVDRVPPGIQLNHGRAEEVLPQHPDLILAGQFTDGRMVEALRRLGYPIEVVDVPTSLSQAEAHIRAFGALVGEPERAAHLIAAMQAREAQIRARRYRDAPLAVIYAANGVSAGGGTLMNEILDVVGLRNLAAELGMQGYGQLSLESLVAARPDMLVLEWRSEQTDAVAQGILHHPAMQALARHARRVVLPPRLTVCVGPMVFDAMEQLLP